MDVQNRRNNGLERQNRCMNKLLPRSHPLFIVFAQTLEEEGRDQINRLNSIRNGHRKALKYSDVDINKPSAACINFKVPVALVKKSNKFKLIKAKEKAKGKKGKKT